MKMSPMTDSASAFRTSRKQTNTGLLSLNIGAESEIGAKKHIEKTLVSENSYERSAKRGAKFFLK